MNDNKKKGLFGALAMRIKKITNKKWEVKLQHEFRECNGATNYLANRVTNFSLGVYRINIPNNKIKNWLWFDFVGITRSRIVNV